jgi:hypothetical protein
LAAIARYGFIAASLEAVGSPIARLAFVSSGRDSAPTRAYLSIGAMYRNEADYLAEWIEFHLLVGVERFFLYDNRSGDDHRAVLAPYIEERIVELTEWPEPFPGSLHKAFEDCIERHLHDSRWIAFLDIDEFLFSPTGRPLPEVLSEFEDASGVVATVIPFGTSGHRTKPPGLVIENYVRRAREELRHPTKGWSIKSIVDPRRVESCPHGGHYFTYRDSYAVTENHTPVTDEGRHRAPELGMQKLRVNHYWSKSEEEVLHKFDKWDTSGHTRPRSVIGERKRLFNQREDRTITRYVEPLREALARREAASPRPPAATGDSGAGAGAGVSRE